MCSNSEGSFSCSCNPGFYLDDVDHMSCVGESCHIIIFMIEKVLR